MPVFKRKYRSGKVAWMYAFDVPGSTRDSRALIRKAGFATKRAAEEAERERRNDVQREIALAPEGAAPLPKTLGQMLEEFFVEHGAKALAPKTLERYREMVTYLSPELRALPLPTIRSLHFSREWNRLLAEGGRNRKTKASRPLSKKTVRNIAGVLSSAYTRAVRWRLTDSNPIPDSEPPTPTRKEGFALTPSQQSLLLGAAHSSWGLAAFLELDAASGARRGELLALRWSDVTDGAILISRSLSQTRAGLTFKSTKSGKARAVAISKSAAKAISALFSEQQKLRQQFGPTYRSDLDLIFCNPDGSPLRPDSVSASVSALFHRLKLPEGASLHTLRHTHGSHLLAAGVDLPTVSARLGHSSTHVTATVYAHALQGGDVEAVKRWEEFQKASAARDNVRPENAPDRKTN